MSREEIIAAIQKCAQDLGRVPSRAELLENTTELSIFKLQRSFGSYVNALEACGLERHGCGYKIDMTELFLDWALVTRKLGKIPSMLDYGAAWKIHDQTFRDALWRLAARAGRTAELCQRDEPGRRVAGCDGHRRGRTEGGTVSRTDVCTGEKAAVWKTSRTHRPVYGPPMMTASPLVYAPTNEAGVMVLFGAVAREQGFAITRVQAAFPDCEAMREVEPEKWQPKKLEFEYESRNFLLHLHPVDGCDWIVCWKHNWPECPLEVLELKTMTWHGPKAKSYR